MAPPSGEEPTETAYRSRPYGSARAGCDLQPGCHDPPRRGAAAAYGDAMVVTLPVTVTGLPGAAEALRRRLGRQYGRAVGTVDYVERVARKAEALLDESIDVVRTARPVVEAVAQAVDDGLVDDLRSAVRQADAGFTRMNRVSGQIEQTVPAIDSTLSRIGRTLPVVERTARAVHDTMPGVSVLPSTRDEIRMAREATERLAGVLNAALEQLEALPGAGLVRRTLVRPAPGSPPPEHGLPH